MSGPLIARAFDAVRLNEIINHPSVYPWVHGLMEGPLDLSFAVADRRNILLMGEYGGILFHCHGPGLYEAHTQVLPEGRGEWCLTMTHAALYWMFTQSDCLEVLTRVPKGNLAARALTRAAGLTSRLINPAGWAFNGKIVPAEVFGLTVQDWMAKAPLLHLRGQKVRQKLRGIDLGPDDRHLGAAFDMILGGQPQKGVVFFNRWAAMTDQPPIAMSSRKPLAFKYRDVLIVVRASGDYYAVGTDLRAAS